jgi:mono/diheme cytochrome c family protein
MRVRGLVVAAVAVVCSLVVVFSSGLAAGGGKRRIDSACLGTIVGVPPGYPRLLHTVPPVALTSILEVLPARGTPGPEYSVVWIDYVRFLAAGPGQTRFFLIPGIFGLRLSAACLRSLPPSARRRYRTEAREQRTGSVTIEALDSEGALGLGVFPDTAQAIEAGRALLAIPGESSSTMIVSGVVPDGVASVTATEADGKTVTAPVASNFFFAQMPRSKQQSLLIEWHAADGSLSKTVRIERVPGSALLETGGPTAIAISPPPAVVKAGGQQLAEFEQGRMVTAQSGCLACHRIGQAGNNGPGPDLTHIGSVLSPHRIERALIDPTAPMPSFKNLPAARFKAVVTFLSDLS